MKPSTLAATKTEHFAPMVCETPVWMASIAPVEARHSQEKCLCYELVPSTMLAHPVPARFQDRAQKVQRSTKHRMAIVIGQVVERSPEELEDVTMVIERLV